MTVFLEPLPGDFVEAFADAAASGVFFAAVFAPADFFGGGAVSDDGVAADDWPAAVAKVTS